MFKRAAATVVLLAGPMAICLYGGLIELTLAQVAFPAVVPLVTGLWLYWLGTQDGL
jgi:hypothetical protein